MNKVISLFEKKQLERDIKKLDRNEHIEILNIIKKHQQKFSRNNKGIFFNLKYIDDPTLREIILFVEFCKNNSILLNNKSPLNPGVTIRSGIESGHMLEQLSLPILPPDIVNIKNNKYNNFTFKNYLDKISIIPKKEFKNKQSEIYPDLINVDGEFTGHTNRLLKKCKNYDAVGNTHAGSSNILESEANI